MFAAIGVAVRYASGVIRNLVRARLWLATMLFAMAWNPAHVMASTTALSPTLSVVVFSAPRIYGEFSSPTFKAHVSPIPYVFEANLELPGSLLGKGDLYFGFMPPGGTKIFTWTADGGTLGLKEGLAPLVRGIDMNNKSTVSASGILGQDIQYTFTGTEPAGMYLIIGLFVLTDADPFDERNWIRVNMAPLIFRP